MSLVYSTHYTEPLVALANTQLPLDEHIDAILKPPFAPDAILDVLQDGVPHQVVLARIAVGLYTNALDLYLNEASTAQEDAEWWAEVEQSNQLAALYLLQSKRAILLVSVGSLTSPAFPKRILNLLRVLRSSNGVLHRPSSLRDFFLNQGQHQPNPFASIFFPHLKSIPLARVHPVFYVEAQTPTSTFLSILSNTVRRVVNGIAFALYFPLRLSRDECRLKREDNENIRNDKAEVLGKLIGMRPALMRALTVNHEGPSNDGAPHPDFLAEFVIALGSAASVELSEQAPLVNFVALFKTILVTRKEEHASYLDDKQLRRPSRLTLLWPRLLLLPPLTLYCVKTLYASRATLTDLAKDTLETIHTFVVDWLLEPLREVLRTIRAGGEEGVIVRREAVSADLNVCCFLVPGSNSHCILQSLERMALALAEDKLGYTQAQLATLSDKIRMGDLTPILEIYEDDIKQPFKSAVAGTLLRSLFVQIQKAKVRARILTLGPDRLSPGRH